MESPLSTPGDQDHDGDEDDHDGDHGDGVESQTILICSANLDEDEEK